MRWTNRAVGAALGACLMGGCADDSADEGRLATDDRGDVTPTAAPAEPVEIEESDIFALSGNTLYLHSPLAGLRSIDVSVPEAPRLQARLDEVAGKPGELYARENNVLVLLNERSCDLPAELGGFTVATTSELVSVTSPSDTPTAAGRLCLPGTVVASRLIGERLYTVTRYEAFGDAMTWVAAVDVTDLAQPTLLDVEPMPGSGFEVYVTEDAIFLTQGGPDTQRTEIRYIDLSDPEGRILERGSVTVEGAPAGRFHMDAQGRRLRIVTNGGLRAHLHVVDFENPDAPLVRGSLRDIGVGEELHATRFIGDRAYVVTYENRVVFTDPLWVIDLAVPDQPRILGHLEIPGWSDFLFPRGHQLLAVGRGDRGQRVAASLFDIEDPRAPRELTRLEFGAVDATSEANTDFRAVTLLERETGDDLMVVPVTNESWTNGACQPHSFIQLVRVKTNELELAGAVEQMDRALRTVPIADQLYALSQRAIQVNSLENPDAPVARNRLDLDSSAPPARCLMNRPTTTPTRTWDDDDIEEGGLYCTFATPGRAPGTTGFGLLAALGLLAWRRARR